MYIINVRASPESVPLGMDLLGFFKSPDILAPLYLPLETAIGPRTLYLRKDTPGSGEQNPKEVLEVFSPLSLASRRPLGEPRLEVIHQGL